MCQSTKISIIVQRTRLLYYLNMKLHFSASLHEIDKHIATYEFIERTIKDNGHSIIKEWLQEYREKKTKSARITNEEWEAISNDTIAAIHEADAIVIEASFSTFNMGYLSALALAYKKPLLMLFNSRPQGYILDAGNSLRRAEVYRDHQELEEMIMKFLKDVDVNATKLRFNMTLDRETYNFLNWESASTGKTKAQIIREIIKDKISERS